MGLGVSELSDNIYSSAMGIRLVDLSEYQKQLYSEKYTKIIFEKIVGKSGYVEVLDENGTVLYKTGGSNGGYTKRELDCIVDFDGYPSYTGVDAVSLNESGETLVVFYSRLGEETQRLLIGADGSLLAGEIGGTSDPLTERELALLNGSYETNFAITKYNFTAAGGERTLILHSRLPDENAYSSAGRITDLISAGYAAAGILLFLLMAYVLSRKVKKPIALLKTAIENVAGGGTEPVVYKGPSEFMQICESFNAMSRRLEESEQERQKLEAERQKMLADISHDLKTPVTVIRGYATALTQQLVPPEEQRQYLMAISRKAENLSELVDSFHEFSKLAHPQFVLEKSKIELCEYAREYLAGKYDEICLAGFELEPEIPDETIYCAIDKVQFARALDNLISNSLRHSGAGAVITFLIYSDDDAAHIIVADNGTGIPFNAASTIFEPFVTGDDARGAHGSGLGLAIAKKTVIEHGGYIRLVIPPENGYSTEFEIVIPII